MDVVQVDVVGLQTVERPFQVLAQRAVRVASKAVARHHLGGDYHLVAHRGERLSDNPLVVPAMQGGKVRPVHFGRVEERATMLERSAYRLDAVALIGNLAVAVGEGHAAHAHLRHFDAVESPRFHSELLCD